MAFSNEKEISSTKVIMVFRSNIFPRTSFRNALYFSTSGLYCKSSVTTQHWHLRQSKDLFVKQAKIHNFRCRSAYKLLQIDEKHNILKPGNVVIDCGAAPGSWSQVAATKTNSNKEDKTSPFGKVIGIDKQHIYPVEGVVFLTNSDFASVETQRKLLELLNGKKVDVVLSDMAPNPTGVKQMDHDYLVELSYKVLRFAVLNSKVNATLLVKLWAGNGIAAFEYQLKRFYNAVNTVKPAASRSESSEIYLLARKFKGAKLKEKNETESASVT